MAFLLLLFFMAKVIFLKFRLSEQSSFAYNQANPLVQSQQIQSWYVVHKIIHT